MDNEIKNSLRNSFYAFVTQGLEFSHPELQIRDDPYLKYLCGEMERLLVTPGDKAVFNLPPRVLKTWLGIFGVTWRLGRHPNHEVIVVTYSDRLVREIAYKIRKIMQANWYQETFPRTRIASDRAAVNSFKTTKGGGVFATSMRGSLAGFGADLIVVDDPNDIADAASAERLKTVNRIFDTEVMTRRNNPRTANVMIIQHRVHENDLTSHVLRTGEFRQIVLALVAVKKKRYRLSDGSVWVRKKGELLRAGIFSKKQLDRMRDEPMFGLLQQQGLDRRSNERILSGHFRNSPPGLALGARVISVDPGLKGGLSNSYSVAQVWHIVGDTYHLIEQIRVQCDGNEFEKYLRRLIGLFRPSALLIESTANGVILASNMRRRFPSLRIEEIDPGQDSKSTRLARHRRAIRNGVISLPPDVYWRIEFIHEFLEFPGPFTDQVDATTQFLDFMKTNPALKLPPERAAPAGVTATGGSISYPNGMPKPDMQARGVVAYFGSWRGRRF